MNNESDYLNLLIDEEEKNRILDKHYAKCFVNETWLTYDGKELSWTEIDSKHFVGIISMLTRFYKDRPSSTLYDLIQRMNWFLKEVIVSNLELEIEAIKEVYVKGKEYDSKNNRK